MKTAAIALLLMAASPGLAQPVRHQVGPAAPTAAPSGPMHVDDWASLGIAAELPSGRLDIKPQDDHAEEITVYGTRNRRDREWRAELHDDPGYEPADSVAGQRLYAPGPTWSSPDEQHMMSGAKEAAGACGALFGLITCPDK